MPFFLTEGWKKLSSELTRLQHKNLREIPTNNSHRLYGYCNTAFSDGQQHIYTVKNFNGVVTLTDTCWHKSDTFERIWRIILFVRSFVIAVIIAPFGRFWFPSHKHDLRLTGDVSVLLGVSMNVCSVHVQYVCALQWIGNLYFLPLTLWVLG